MSSDVAISVRGLSKSYTIRHNQEHHTTFGEAMVHRLKHPLQRPERPGVRHLTDQERPGVKARLGGGPLADGGLVNRV